MKKTVFIVTLVCTLILGGIFVFGFIQKQLKEREGADQATNSQTNSSTTSPSTATQTTATYTLAQISKHSSEKDCWLLINNKVYDVTKFIPDHPGGVSQIIPYCGKEATQAFDTQGGRGRPHSPTADEMLKDYYIGNLSQ